MKNWGYRKADELSERWPKTDEGEPIQAAFLQHVAGSELDVELSVNLLEAYGIPVLRKPVLDGDLGKVILGYSGPGEDLFVPETMLEDAQNIISAEVVEEESDPDTEEENG